MKKRSKKERDYLESFKYLACQACGIEGEEIICCEHVKTRGSGGSVTASWNTMPICNSCHDLKGRTSVKYMAEKFPTYKKWLIDNKWTYDEFYKKWRHYGEA